MRRRDVMAAAAGAALLARPALAAAQGPEPADVLTRALRFEHASLVAYDAATQAGALRPADERRLRLLRGHEAEHAEALAQALRGLGAAVPAPPRAGEPVEVPQLRAAIDALDGRESALALLVTLEELSLEVYRAALGTLRDVGHLRLVATILATEATHLAAWRAVG